MHGKSKSFAKRLSILSLVVIMMLCVAMVLHAEHIGTLLNNRVTTQSFGDILEKTSQKDTRAEDFELPTDWWIDGSTVASGFDGGSGSSENPYLIATPEQLALMANRINYGDSSYLSASYQLTADIDMSGHFWAPMGMWEGDKAFRGTLDGATHDIGADGKDNGTIHTISNLIMKNRGDITNGTMVGLFGLLGDQAVVTNLIIDNSISYLDYEIELSERVSLAIVAAQVKKDATVLFQNMLVSNSSTFSPQTMTEDGSEGIDFIQGEVKSGIYVGWQQGVDEYGQSDKGVIYMNEAHARMSSVLINIYVDLSGWDMSPDIVVHSVGGLIGEARQVDIQNSSYEGVVGLEMVRRDRNMDNAQLIFNAGGAIGTMDPYVGTTSYFENVDLSGSIYLDTFKNENDGFNRNVASAQSSKDTRAVDWVADVRQIGGIIGDANMWGQGSLNIKDVNSSFFVDAPKGGSAQLGDRQFESLSEPDSLNNVNLYNSDLSTQDAITQALVDGDTQSPELLEMVKQAKFDQVDGATYTGEHAFVPHTGLTRDDTGLEGPPTAPGGPIALAVYAPVLIVYLSYYAIVAMNFLAISAIITTFLGLFLAIVFAIIIIIAILVFAVLFAFWGVQKPKWRSEVFVGSAIGSPGREGITLNNVHTANAVIASDTMFSKDDKAANKTNSHHTTPTRGMIISQPDTPKLDNIGDKATLSVSAKGTVMNDGSAGVDSVLEYQWYYNTIDSNNILLGDEPGMGGAKTVKVEGATEPTLDVTVEVSGSRYYFVQVTNHVIEFHGNVVSVTSKIGNKHVSAKPAEIIKQPEDLNINIGTADKTLSVVAQASGDITYQWYFNTSESTENAILLSGGNDSEFVPLQQQAGTYYYYVVVTTSVEVVGTDETLRADTISNFAKVQVDAVANNISISVQPAIQKTVEKNMNTIIGITVDLSKVNGTLSYQWYKAKDAFSDGVAIEGENGQSLVVDTHISDTTNYYYVIAYNTVGDSVTSIKSEASAITVSKEQALKIDEVEQPHNAVGIAGSKDPVSVHARFMAGEGGVLTYQWYQTDSFENTNEGDLVPNSTSPTLSVMEDYASTKYYYVQISSIKPDGTIGRQKSDTVSIEFKDLDQYKFDLFKDTLLNTQITSPQSETNKTVDLYARYSGYIDLNVSLDGIETVGTINYQWYVSDSADGSDAVSLPGAVGNSWRVERDSAIGTKYYFVKVINTAYIYNAVLSKQAGTPVYSTTINDINLPAVAVAHTAEKSGSMVMLIVISTATAVVLALAAGAIIFFKNRKSEEDYCYRMYK